MQTVGQRIKDLRAAKKVTQAQVGAAVGIAQTSVKDIETGNSKNPAALTLIKLAKYFEVDPEWLLTGKGQKSPVATFTTEEVELLLLYRAVSPDGQVYILGRARSVHEGEHGKTPHAPTSMDDTPPPAKPH